ncbi:TatD family deoxyribonuclease [Duganella sp. FT92W]|uniref:TatD family deoxyribonuclease n=1 Tax=Pseudoduganella rivuli TaxID=2666085 RepID=A0A7X2LS83_9BURK|nr:Qat anti-phage system TatD family nuclease QatD [Pseudoduganella rivuli]MRV70682.1 TatD family deoxyribonuclease [Pseudoduganella rivuli]
MRPEWVDFHCHVDLYADHLAIIDECDQAKVATLAVTTTPKAWQRNQELAASSKFVRVALGLHPQLVAERASEVNLFEKLLEYTPYVGEVGLDAGPQFYSSFPEQERIFLRIISACVEQGGKILSVHSVRSVGKVLQHLERLRFAHHGQAVLHWFTGTAAEAKRAAELGCYFSINSEMLKSPKHRSLITKLPRDRLLSETDGPFVTYVDRPARPVDVASTVANLAEALNITPEATRVLIIRNLTNLMKNSKKNIPYTVHGSNN